jgi:predicted amidohydrolase
MIATAVQMHSTPDVNRNVNAARELMLRAVKEHGSDWLILPEHFQWAGGPDSERQSSAEVLGEGPAYTMCREFARTHKVFVHAGSIFEKIPDDNRIFNTSVAFDRDGREVARYRKAHLFDITAPDGAQYRESATVKPGSEAVVYEIGGITVGCAICYDLRFPDLFQTLVGKGARLIALPAAFNRLTGEAHWEALLRARAIETQTYIAAAGSVGPDNDQDRRGTHGHSMLVDPWGRVVGVLPRGDGFVSCEVDLELIDKVRQDMPVASHRRQTLYSEWRQDA